MDFPVLTPKKKCEKNNPLNLATEAVVIMISGINPLDPSRFKIKTTNQSARFKQVRYFHFAV